MKSRHKTRIKFLSKDEVDRVIAVAHEPREIALVHVLFSTGLRIAECVAIHRKEFDEHKEQETRELSIIGKGGWQRVVFFSPLALQALKAYLSFRQDKDARLFPLTKRTAERIVSRLARSAGLKATPHTFRHSLATHLLKQGANIRVVQEMLGHRSLSSTMVYTGVTNRDLLEVHKKLV